MGQLVTIGLNLATSVFQAHGVDVAGESSEMGRKRTLAPRLETDGRENGMNLAPTSPGGDKASP